MPTASCQKIPVGRIRASPHRHRRSVQRMRRTEPIGRPATASRVIRPGRFRRVRAGVARSRGRPFSNPRTRGCATERGNWARGFTVTARGGAITGRLLRRPGQVAVVSPILVQAAFDCALSSTVGGPTSSRHSGLAPGEAAVSPSPRGTSGAPPSPYRTAVSFLLRCSGSHPAGSHPPPWSLEWGLSSAGYRCRTPPPSAALCLLANGAAGPRR